MNKRLVFYTLGKVLCVEALLLCLPLIVALIYGEALRPFLITMGITASIGALAVIVFRTGSNLLFIRDGFAIVSLSWIVMSMAGALPFVISGQIPSYIDALFETMSGFTTTGASILTDVEALSHGILFWRSLTHWIGGMGVLVFIMAIAEKNPDRSINIMKAEMPGSKVDKLRPKAKTNALVLYYIYLGMTVLEIIFLLAGGMSLFDSLVHTFGTAGTGGFGIKADSIGGYSPYLQWVIAIFMVLFGVNFGIYNLILLKRIGQALSSIELRVYLCIIFFATMIIMVNISSMFASEGEALRQSFFQVASIITTTGYATTDFNAWPQLSKTVLFILMFIGGCEGSTAGGLKVSRVVIMTKEIKREINKTIHPRIISSVRLDGKAMTKDSLSGVNAYLWIYLLIMVVALLFVTADGFDFETNVTAVVSCMNNIGPGLSKVGPCGSFAEFSNLSKLVLTLTMLLGRLEIYPVLLAL